MGLAALPGDVSGMHDDFDDFACFKFISRVDVSPLPPPLLVAEVHFRETRKCFLIRRFTGSAELRPWALPVLGTGRTGPVLWSRNDSRPQASVLISQPSLPVADDCDGDPVTALGWAADGHVCAQWARQQPDCPL